MPAKKSAAKKPRPGPMVPQAHTDEQTSRRRFEDVFPYWLVTPWNANDYGVDVMVEITAPITEDRQRFATGKKFAAQLKARSDPPDASGVHHLSITTTHLRYWLNATEHVLIVLYHTPTGRMFHKWIDDGLIHDLNRRTPAWPAQQSVTLDFGEADLLSEACVDRIADYASRRKRITQGHLAPGDFFRLKRQLSQQCQQLDGLANALGSQAIRKGLDEAMKGLERGCYLVAIAGPSRAGKSSLLNVLVGNAVSPVNLLPTTAVPTMVLPSDKPSVEVIFDDGRREEYPVSVETITKYVTQDENPDNQRRVKLLQVRLVNATLERGIAILDIPGLDDLSGAIQAVTMAALEGANAVVYVIDASPHAQGGFALRRQDVDNLNKLARVSDRLFFVLNKADTLDAAQREQLLAYVQREFKKYGIDKSLPTPPLVVSAKEAAAKRAKGETHDSVADLEAALWDFLVNTQKTGLDTLGATSSHLLALLDEAESLLRARIITVDDVRQLRGKMQVAQAALGTLRPQMENEKQRILRDNAARLQDSKEQLLQHFASQLEAIPEAGELPKDAHIKHYLEEYARAAFSQEVECLRAELTSASALASRVAAEALADLHDQLQRAHTAVDVPPPAIPVDMLGAPSSPLPFLMSVFGFFAGLAAGPGSAIALGLLSLFGGLAISHEQLRRKKINHLLKVARRTYDEAFVHATASLAEYAVQTIDGVTSTVDVRARLFIIDLNAQLVRKGRTLTTEDVHTIREQLTIVETRREAIRQVAREIRRVLY